MNNKTTYKILAFDFDTKVLDEIYYKGNYRNSYNEFRQFLKENKFKENKMATIMEKDVLIEMTMATIAKISRALDDNTTTIQASSFDNDFLWDLRDKLYASREWEWDYDKTLAQIKEIGSRYKGSL